MTFEPSNSLGPFLQTSIYFPEDFEEFRVKFLAVYRNIAAVTNAREVGLYDQVELQTGEQWFNPLDTQFKRMTFRTVYSIGAIGSGVTLNTAHGLTAITSFTHIYGTAVTAFPDFRPIPYSSVTAVNQQIEIRVDTTNIIISNGAAAPGISSAIVVLEYLKN